MRRKRSLAQKEKLLEKIFREMGDVVVALSAGVDSSLTLAVAYRVLKEKAVGVVAISPSLSQDSVKLARRVAKLIGAELIEVETYEVEDPEYQKNNPLRCYFCKHIVYSELKKIAEQKHAFLVDGFNTDDTAETRPGMRAAKEQRVRHPLFEAGLTKKDVRTLARKYGLPNWNKAADACLSSRFLTGVPVNSSLLQLIGKAESKTRTVLSLGPEHALRVRHLADGKARVEIDTLRFPIPPGVENKVRNIMKSFGYADISFATYRRGSVSAVVENLGFAQIDHGRFERTGIPEVVFCEGKTPEQAAEIFSRLAANSGFALATRVKPRHKKAIQQKVLKAVWHEQAGIMTVGGPLYSKNTEQYVVVVTAGTGDIPVAEEARVTLEFFGIRVEKLYDVGVAGIDRLLEHRPLLERATAVIAVAGMDGACPVVTSALTPCLVIGVPTAIGYGMGRGGKAALRTMLNSCVPGVVTVNIGNGFGAACAVVRALKN